MKPTRTVLFSLALLLAASVAFAKGRSPREAAPQAPAKSASQAAPSPLLATLTQEMDREMGVFGKADPPAYFVRYTLTDDDHAAVTGSNGALLSSAQNRNRWLEGQVRVGNYQLDDTHHVGNDQNGVPGSFGESVPIDDDAAVLQRAMWRETEAQYRDAAEAWDGPDVHLARGFRLVVPAEVHRLVANQNGEHRTDHQRDEQRDGVGDHAAGAESGMMRRGRRMNARPRSKPFVMQFSTETIA